MYTKLFCETGSFDRITTNERVSNCSFIKSVIPGIPLPHDCAVAKAMLYQRIESSRTYEQSLAICRKIDCVDEGYPRRSDRKTFPVRTTNKHLGPGGNCCSFPAQRDGKRFLTGYR